MCGICAILSLKKAPITPDLIKKTGDLLKHRGPDDKGYSLFYKTPTGWNNIINRGEDERKNSSSLPDYPIEGIKTSIKDFSLAFCHRRLSIIDLSPAGHQPMCYKNRYWIIYNGEVYNYLELREELKKSGHIFQSNSDTEVILAAYDEWGLDCLNHFIGMWAFLIFDTETGELFGSRDRFGIKPLYYWFSHEGYLAFASEIKAFTVIPGWNSVVNGQRAYDFLIHGITDHTSETMFSNVYQLMGGEYFIVKISDILDTLPIQKWYSINHELLLEPFDQSVQSYLLKLSESIKIHLRSDVNIGSCLSGGLDSSAIVSIINKIIENNSSEQDQKTFSACSEQKRWDEREFIEAVLEGKDIDAHFVTPDVNGLVKDLNEILWHQDEPFGSTSIYAQWSVFRTAKENNVKVLLDGQGADEPIGGYHYFHDIFIASLLQRLKIPTLLHEVNELNTKYKRSYSDIIRSSLYYILSNNSIGRKILLLNQKESIDPKWLDRKKIGAEITFPLSLTQTVKGIDLFTRYCYHQTFQASLPALLHYEDRNSMAFSIESRVPYLDHRIVEYIINLPDNYKIKNAVTKYVMRHSLKGYLPEKVRCRMDKMGFVTPEEYWMKIENPEIFKDYLGVAIKNSKGIIKPEAMDYFKKMVSGKIPFSNVIWRMIIFGLWMELYQVNLEMVDK